MTERETKECPVCGEDDGVCDQLTHALYDAAPVVNAMMNLQEKLHQDEMDSRDVELRKLRENYNQLLTTIADLKEHLGDFIDPPKVEDLDCLRAWVKVRATQAIAVVEKAAKDPSRD